jgi:hypothetical protein
MKLCAFKFVWQGYADKHKDEALNLQLVKVQIFLSQGNVYGACDALKALGDLQYKPGVVSGTTTMKTLSMCNPVCHPRTNPTISTPRVKLTLALSSLHM